VHLEEDAAKLVHAGASGRIHGAEASVVDFNRGGTPLVEIVTEPDLRSAADAAEWLRLLRATIKRLGVSDVNMEEGSLRGDANVSIRPLGEATLGVKTELKNMNSFRFLQRGIEAEVARQEELVRGGGEVTQETLHFDPRTGALSPLRSKEEIHDYRYFPEPDLVPLAPTEEMLARARAALPELPAERAERFQRELELPEETARLLAYRAELGDFFEQAVAADGGVGGDGAGRADPRTLASWVTVELVPRLGDREPEESPVTPAALAKLAGLVSAKAVSQSAAKQVLDVMAESGGDPEALVRERGLALAGGDELAEIVDRVLAANQDAVEQIRKGKGKAIGAIIGAVMRETQGRADGSEVQRMIRERIGA
jgi:aspartyl-tRNA(Asn)/glutamyl-tRNA(Gln) amidotransferase subunit B